MIKVYYAAVNGKRKGKLYDSKEKAFEKLLRVLERKETDLMQEDISCIAEEVRNKDWFEAFDGKTYSIEEETVF